MERGSVRRKRDSRLPRGIEGRGDAAGECIQRAVEPAPEVVGLPGSGGGLRSARRLRITRLSD